jgi:[amino group carrier protein]-lysine/ornithine hydrolase
MDEASFLSDLLTLYSPSGSEAPVAAFLRERMAELGYHSWVDEVGNAVGEIGEGGREVVLLGHIDTVEGFVPVRREGDLLYGRGAVDAKGPMAAFVLAAARARTRDLRLVVVGAVEEEAASSRGARHAVARPRPDFAVIGEPSGWSAITLGYKGRLWITYVLEQPMRHSAGPGHAAPEEAVQFWNALAAEAAGRNQGRRPFDALDPSLRRINSSSDGFADRVEQLISLRVPVDFDAEDFKRQVVGLAGPATIEFSNEDPAFRADKNNALVRAFTSAIRAHSGEPKFKLKTGTSDMNVLGPAWGCPIVAYGAGDSSLDHTPNEHISLAEFRQSVLVLTSVLEAL